MTEQVYVPAQVEQQIIDFLRSHIDDDTVAFEPSVPNVNNPNEARRLFTIREVSRKHSVYGRYDDVIVYVNFFMPVTMNRQEFSEEYAHDNASDSMMDIMERVYALLVSYKITEETCVNMVRLADSSGFTRVEEPGRPLRHWLGVFHYQVHSNIIEVA